MKLYLQSLCTCRTTLAGNIWIQFEYENNTKRINTLFTTHDHCCCSQKLNLCMKSNFKSQKEYYLQIFSVCVTHGNRGLMWWGRGVIKEDTTSVWMSAVDPVWGAKTESSCLGKWVAFGRCVSEHLSEWNAAATLSKPGPMWLIDSFPWCNAPALFL